MNTCAGIDVVILTLDRLNDTLECIQSVLNQDYPDIRLWIVDQGSCEETVTTLKDRSKRDNFTVVETGLTGVPAGRNTGYRLGNAPIIVSLDNDAVFSDTSVLTRVERRFVTEARLGALAFAIHDYASGGPDVGSWGFPLPVEEWFDKEFLAARFCGAGHAISRRAFEQTEGYDEALFFFGEELDLSWSMVDYGYLIRYAPETSVRHKSSEEGRIHWSDGRFYYNVRNILYLNYKYFRRPTQFFNYAIGYLIKGAFSGLFSATLKGIRDAWKLSRSDDIRPPLGVAARSYVQRYEFAPRGSVWRRLRDEVLVRLTARNAS